MFELIFLAFALSMDAFAVSVGLGSKPELSKPYLFAWCAGYFGVFQGLMPLVGVIGGKGIATVLTEYVTWVACALLVVIGIKMIKESFEQGVEEGIKKINHTVMLSLAVATSIDAMAAGLTFSLLQVSALWACLVIGLITAFMSALGVWVGKLNGAWLEGKAECVGGVVLIAIAAKLAVTGM